MHLPAFRVAPESASFPYHHKSKRIPVLHAISWFLALALLLIWTACVWVLHSLAVWSLTGVGAMVGQSQQIDRLTVPGWIDVWIPSDLILTFKTTAANVLPWIESALSVLPSVGAWLSPLAWIVWGVGLVILMVGSAALHALISVTRRAAVQ